MDLGPESRKLQLKVNNILSLSLQGRSFWENQSRTGIIIFRESDFHIKVVIKC